MLIVSRKPLKYLVAYFLDREKLLQVSEEKIKNYIKTNSDYSQKILNALKNKIPGKFFQMETTDQLLIIVTDEEAFKIFNEQQTEKDVSFTEFVSKLLEEELGI